MCKKDTEAGRFLHHKRKGEQQMKLPKYINCRDNNQRCQYYLSKLCRETCYYAEDSREEGIGAMSVEDVSRLEKEVGK